MKVAYLPDPVKVDSKPGYPPPSVRDRLEREGGFTFEQITVRDLLGGCLSAKGFTVLCLPGGYAPNYDDQLGARGARVIRKFVEGGGGFVGLCAGAYYGSTWGIGLLPVEVMDIEHWARGKGACTLVVTPAGQAALGVSGDMVVRYNNGPLLGILDAGDVSALMLFESEFRGRKGRYPRLMKDSPAVVYGRCGKGGVVLVSPHVEDAESPAGVQAFRRFFELVSPRSGSGGGGGGLGIGSSSSSSLRGGATPSSGFVGAASAAGPASAMLSSQH